MTYILTIIIVLIVVWLATTVAIYLIHGAEPVALERERNGEEYN